METDDARTSGSDAPPSPLPSSSPSNYSMDENPSSPPPEDGDDPGVLCLYAIHSLSQYAMREMGLEGECTRG
jgi:hypothetical protein